MSQPNRPRNPGQPTAPNVLPGVLSALVVVAVLGLLAVLLLNRPSPRQEQAISATEAVIASNNSAATSAAALAQITPEPSLPADGTPASQTAGAPKTYSAPPPITIDPAKSYTATITTPRGDIVVRLRPDLAPETVNSFVFLSREGFYDGLTWHRVLPNFMAQGGDPTGTGGGGPGYTIPDEYTDQVLFDKPGIVAMASTGAGTNSGGSQFFITTAPYPSLNSQYTIFGEVTQGQDIVDAIPLRDPNQNPTTPGEQIVKITISEG